MYLQVEKLANLLLQGDEERAWKLILEEHRKGTTSLTLFQELISPSMKYIGDLWEEDKIKVADEHLATITCDYLLSRYQMLLKGYRRNREVTRKAMFLCLEDEQHYLGVKMVSLLFEEYGWETQLLGANLPLEYTISAAEKWKPDVVALSFSILYHATRLSKYVVELEKLEHKPMILIGGRLVSHYDFSTYSENQTKVVHSLSELSDWLSYDKGGRKIVD
ncbi:cobalamin B12-binding domain-containing protein [Metabacillus iocasae]|uniref:Methanogenic corrinoid protein MtbC1 n=1 Tax=Priestia iocasae TaxID=2291674 RepID=A0ABS2QXU0_9BACI|nr:cobalamin-dependent protein [Metabacillus iocasae]MBM7704295.1 methanogenic corrinoid protein MtbC1 [Metabacillus iocasae]